jgi:quercetin dioxygenase-like cupin family protein
MRLGATFQHSGMARKNHCPNSERRVVLCAKEKKQMKAEPFVVTPKDYQASLQVLGIHVTVLASRAATQAYEITRQQGNEGMGPPPHSHGWDESFYIVAGTVEFTCAGKSAVCSPGTLVHVPADTVHSFKYLTDNCDVLEFTGQGGHASEMFTAVAREIPPGPPEVPKLLAVLKDNGVTVHL